MAKVEQTDILKDTFSHKKEMKKEAEDYFKRLRAKIIQDHPEFDIQKLERAYGLSCEVHQFQKRETGLPYITHPVAVAKILYDTGGNEDMVCAALLHDVIEDAHVTKEHLEKLFGTRIARIVALLSKEEDWQTAYCRIKSNLDEMEAVWDEYPEAIIVKMADRLHNIQTIDGFLSLKKQQDYLIETKQLLLPVFHDALETPTFDCYFPLIKKLLKRLSTKLEIEFKRFNIRYLEEKRAKKSNLETNSIVKYEGWNGVQKAYTEILHEAIRTHEPILAFEKNREIDTMRQEFFDHYIRERFRYKIKACVITPKTSSDRIYKKKVEGPLTEVLMIDNFDFVTNMNVVGDVVLMFSANPIQGTVRRNGKEAQMFKSMFWRTWKTSVSN